MQELSGETGITPAYAGKRQRRATACTWLRDHPRVCGEKDAICKSCPARQGSPSRMRGKAGWPLCGLPCIGITPAYAGKSQPWRSYSQRRWDHPRVCGEKRPAVDGKRPLRGSPPHVRGKVKDPVPVSALVGITPACAGKRSAQAGAPAGRRDHPRVCGEKFNSGSMLKQMGDHPRVCGEKIVLVIVFCSLMGSPPRMRGKVMRKEILRIIHGITPAYAGKSAYLSPEDTAGRDHPRVCGEKYSWEKSTCKIFGSPPRMRGKAGLVQIVCRLRGITPAYAGKSHKVRLQAPGRWDHPRVCGEKA